MVTQRIKTFATISVVLVVALPTVGFAEKKRKGSWQILLCTQDKASDERAEPFTLRFNEKTSKAQLGNEFDATINDARIDFFIPYSTTDKDNGMYYSVNRITGRYTSSYYSKDTQFSRAGTCIVAPTKKF